MIKPWIDIGLTQDMIGACMMVVGVLEYEEKWFCTCRQPLVPTSEGIFDSDCPQSVM